MNDKKLMTTLAQRAKNGDMQAYSQLYKMYKNRVFNYLRKKGVSEEDAEDIVNDTFLIGVEKISELRNPAYFSTWIHRIAINEYSKFLRKGYSKSVFSLEEIIEYNDDNDCFSDDTIMLPDDYTENAERQELIQKITESLSDNLKIVIELYYYKGMTIKEIAETTNLNENTVKTRLRLSKERLKSQIVQLQKSGYMFTLVPVSMKTFVEDFSDSFTVSSTSKAATAAVSTVTSKLIAISASFAVIGTIGILWHFNHSSNDASIDTKGDYRPNEEDTSSQDNPHSDINNKEDLIDSSNGNIVKLNSYEYDTDVLRNYQNNEDRYRHAFEQYTFKKSKKTNKNTLTTINVNGEEKRSEHELTNSEINALDEFIRLHFSNNWNDQEKIVYTYLWIDKMKKNTKNGTTNIDEILDRKEITDDNCNLLFAGMLLHMGYDVKLIQGKKYIISTKKYTDYTWGEIVDGKKTIAFDLNKKFEFPDGYFVTTVTGPYFEYEDSIDDNSNEVKELLVKYADNKKKAKYYYIMI